MVRVVAGQMVFMNTPPNFRRPDGSRVDRRGGSPLEFGDSISDQECGEANGHMLLIGREEHPALTDATLRQGQTIWVLQKGASIVLVR